MSTCMHMYKHMHIQVNIYIHIILISLLFMFLPRGDTHELRMKRTMLGPHAVLHSDIETVLKTSL